ncbi:DHA2 family efflux MFS transporter permease subunit [Dictyobacter kobayashii]|uniref:MFS transporter n=1 Tax=Dictyobacter kobayashii TaxID=2014872 RepID=A0A402AZ35_9CHLR|nr:DHA2 family efflux MFS transporter permease subunit [Dictyobacter kobayashii]GCE24327.1 MFS transporter [Dictyobacter kobayashii]
MEANANLSQPSQSANDPGYKWRVLATVVTGLFMVILDSTVINVALKTLQQHYSVSTSEAQWVISLYTLALGIATPLSGFLGDRFGIKRIYLSGLVLFVVGSILCGLAPSLTLLIAARAIQGIGGGISLPLGTALLFRAFPPRERGAAFGIFGIVLVFAPAIGPLLGGWLVDNNLLSWIFFLNIPIGIIGLTIGTLFLHEAPGSAKIRADIPGIILSALGFGAILFATSIAGEQGAGWTDIRVIAGLVIGLLALALFAVVELRSPDPLLDLRLYGIPSFAIANVASMVGTIALFGAEFLLPLYLQILRGQTAFQAGLILLPLAIASAFSSFISGRITDRIGPRVPIVIGFLLIAYNTFQLSEITIDTSINFIIFLLVLRGIAVGLIIQNSQVAALLDVPMARLNRATPLVQATRQTMQSIGVAVLATILTSAITLSMPRNIPSGADLSKLPPAVRQAALNGIHQFQNQYITGLQHAYLATFAIAVVAILLSLFLPGWPGKYQTSSKKAAPAVEQPMPTEVA